MSADGDGVFDSTLRSPTERELTEREWRRPLTWLDRFRDAVLLPASWEDGNIQPQITGNGERILAAKASGCKYLNAVVKFGNNKF